MTDLTSGSFLSKTQWPKNLIPENKKEIIKTDQKFRFTVTTYDIHMKSLLRHNACIIQ